MNKRFLKKIYKELQKRFSLEMGPDLGKSYILYIICLNFVPSICLLSKLKIKRLKQFKEASTNNKNNSKLYFSHVGSQSWMKMSDSIENNI